MFRRNKNSTISRRIFTFLVLHIFVANASMVFAQESVKKAHQTLKKQSQIVEKYVINNEKKKIPGEKYRIKNVHVVGNNNVQKNTILNVFPYRKGLTFDPDIGSIAINNVYSLGYFRKVKVEAEIIDDEHVDLFLILEEKKLLDEVIISGNKIIADEKIEKNLLLKKRSTIDEETLHEIKKAIKKMYEKENRYFVRIKTKLVPNDKDPKRLTAYIDINEGPKSSILRVHFRGNNNIPDRSLRKKIFTRENWLLGFADGAGTYDKEAFEIDKHIIENFYRDRGFLMVKVLKADIKFSPRGKSITVTFHIKEGKKYTIRTITPPDDDLFTKDELMRFISLEEGEPYSRIEVVKSMNALRELWGNKGYIFADVYPQVKPDVENSLVDIIFHAERSDKLYVNRIDITGNKVTRDKVIRRQLDIVEGELITSDKLSRSKTNVEYLSYFKREGVNWKVHRLSDELADLEMNVDEAKTGNANFRLTYGSDKNNASAALRSEIAVEKRNISGLGLDAGFAVEAAFSKKHKDKGPSNANNNDNKPTKRRVRLKKFDFHFADPHILDSDVSGIVNLYRRWDEFEQWQGVDKVPNQTVIGGSLRLGFRVPKIDKRLQFLVDVGIENIRNNDPKARSGENQIFFEPIVRRSFEKGTFKWVGVDLIKDTRNHQVYPNKGYKLWLSSKLAPAGINKDFAFIKGEAQISAYTSLIGVDQLVLATQLRLSRISSINRKNIPYKELFHMGGQNTVRGFIWGGIGPAWTTGDPLGAKNAVQFNTELIFPLIEDYSMKGHVFYDAGAGWSTPKDASITARPDLVKRNDFDLRHSVGFGLNLMKPFPAKIDWGFKLDRRKSLGESPHEFHISMNHAW